MMSQGQKDLVILAADKDFEFTLKGILTRCHSLGIRQPSCDLYVHPHHDPGCFKTGHDFLRPFVNRYTHALVLFDKEGCGQEQMTRDGLEREVEGRLNQSGWGDRASVIVPDPELEIWVWSDSPHVATILGWAGRHPDLMTWLISKRMFDPQRPKPDRPKEAMELVLREVRKSRSSAIFLQLAGSVSLDRCVDPAFLKLKEKLKLWFS